MILGYLDVMVPVVMAEDSRMPRQSLKPGFRPIGRCQTFNATADGYVRTGDAADLRVDLGGRLISEVHRLPLVIS